MSEAFVGRIEAPSNKGLKLTKPGELRSFAAYPRCSADLSGAERVTGRQGRPNDVDLQESPDSDAALAGELCGARVGPTSPKEGCFESDLEPQRAQVPFRKLAGRSD